MKLTVYFILMPLLVMSPLCIQLSGLNKNNLYSCQQAQQRLIKQLETVPLIDLHKKLCTGCQQAVKLNLIIYNCSSCATKLLTVGMLYLYAYFQTMNGAAFADVWLCKIGKYV